MTQDDLIRVAHDAGLWPLLRNTSKTKEAVERFAKMLIEQEREACAALCDDIVQEEEGKLDRDYSREDTAEELAVLIRARNQTDIKP